MYGDFNKLFIENEKPKSVPKSILDALNSAGNFPDGYKYIADGTMCVLVPIDKKSSEEMKMTVQLDITPEVLKECNGDIGEYLYRTQKKLRVKKFKVKINEIEYDMNEIFKFPLNRGILEDGQGVLIPKEFPEGTDVSVKIINGKEFNIRFRRQPYEKMNTILIENETFKVLDIKIYFNEDDEKVDIKLNVNLDKAESVEQLIDALLLFRAFMTSNITFDKERLPKLTDADFDSKWIEDGINLWTRIKKIEDNLKLKFIPGEDLDEENFDDVNKLYSCFVENKPIIYYEPFDYFTVGEMNLKSTEEFLNKPGISFDFIEEYIGEKQINLLGCNFDIYSATVVEDIVITKLEKINDGKTKLYIKSEEGKRSKLSRMFFKSKDEAKDYINKLHNR